MPIGNRKDATTAAKMGRYGGMTCAAEQAGWTILGSGCSRTAYLSPEGVVYKVGQPGSNINEVKRIQTFRKRKPVGPIKFPEASLWNVAVPHPNYDGTHQPVVAMEHIKSDPEAHAYWAKGPYAERLYPIYEQIAEKFNLTDMFLGNIIVAGMDAIYIIDAGEW